MSKKNHRAKKIKIFSEKINKEIHELSMRTERDIHQLSKYDASIFEIMYNRKPTLLHQLMYYDNLVMKFIHNLLVIREDRKNEITKKIEKQFRLK